MAVIAAFAIVPLRYEIGQNADGLIQTLVSLQHLTFFFWDQNRFANLLPLLASFVHDPTTNAEFQLALRIALGCAAPLLFCVPYVRNGGYLGAGRATLLATTFALAFMPQRFVHEWFVEASPYGTSFALSGLALLAFLAAGSSNRLAALPLRAAGLMLIFAAYAVNASLILLTVPIVIQCALIFGSSLAMEFGFASLLAGLATALATNAVSAPQTSMRFGDTFIGLTYYLDQLSGKFGLFPALAISLFLITAVISTTLAPKSGRSGNNYFISYGLILIVTLIVSFVGVSLSSWVVMNLMHPRYLVPCFCLVSALGALSIIHLIECFSSNATVSRKLVLAAAIVLTVYAGSRDLSPVPTENGIVAAPFRSAAAEIANLVTDSGLDGVAGDYWITWPSIFLAEQQAYDLGRPSGQIFGVTYRGRARSAAFATRLIAKRQLMIVCVDLPSLACADQIGELLGRPVSAIQDQPVPWRSPDNHILHVLTVAPR